MRNSRTIALALATLALAIASSLATARPHDDERRGRDGHRREEQSERPRVRISLDQAVAMAERRFNARVVRAESRGGEEGMIYVLRLLNDSGRVWTVKVDATTGAIR